MNFLALFMSILMFASGFDLCAEIKSCDSENNIELSSSTDTHGQESETCTPFCHCSRCAFSVLIPEKTKGNTLNACSINSVKSSQKILATQAGSSIWQPPKFA